MTFVRCDNVGEQGSHFIQLINLTLPFLCFLSKKNFKLLREYRTVQNYNYFRTTFMIPNEKIDSLYLL